MVWLATRRFRKGALSNYVGRGSRFRLRIPVAAGRATRIFFHVSEQPGPMRYAQFNKSSSLSRSKVERTLDKMATSPLLNLWLLQA